MKKVKITEFGGSIRVRIYEEVGEFKEQKNIAKIEVHDLEQYLEDLANSTEAEYKLIKGDKLQTLILK